MNARELDLQQSAKGEHMNDPITGEDLEQPIPLGSSALLDSPDPWGSGLFPLLGTLWALVLVALAEVSFLFYSYSTQSYLFGLVSLLVFLVVLHIGGRIHLVHAVLNHPWRILRYLMIYVAIGFVWIPVYWTIEVSKAARIAMEDKRAWLLTQNGEGTSIPDELIPLWKKHVAANPRLYSPPRWYEHKAELAWRGLFWPISVLHTFLSDLVYEVYLRVVEALGAFLDQISDWWFQDVLKEIIKTPK